MGNGNPIRGTVVIKRTEPQERKDMTSVAWLFGGQAASKSFENELSSKGRKCFG